MSWCLFIDEPIDARGDSPYKVVAGLAVEDKHIWPLTVKLYDANLHYFGRQLRAPNSAYLKASDLLSHDIFLEAQHVLSVSNTERVRLIHEALDESAPTIINQRVALSQAKISYCRFITNLIRDYEVRAFAVMAPANVVPVPLTNQLRRDYAFLLERFFYFLDDQLPASTGYLLLSELNKYGVSANTLSDYFLKTSNGKVRSRSIIPEPLFTRGRINIIFQSTSLLGYALCWGFRTPTMHEPTRPELESFTSQFRAMRYLHTSSNGKKDWSFKFIGDL